MRPIHLAYLDKTRPVLILTRQLVRPYLNSVTVAPITSTIRGLSTELILEDRNGIGHESAVSLDNITTIPVDKLGKQIGYLFHDQEQALSQAIIAAFDLD